jgi:hypothetical protein
MGPPGTTTATDFGRRFAQLWGRLGLPIMESKSLTGTTGPADFGGIEIESIAMEASPPSENLEKATELVWPAHTKGKLSLLELQSHIGLLSFCGKVVPLGRGFLRRE